MKQRISLSRLLHNDKLMMIVSLVLAIVVWALVVYGPNNAQERVITGVPVSITLNAYATDTRFGRAAAESAQREVAQRRRHAHHDPGEAGHARQRGEQRPVGDAQQPYERAVHLQDQEDGAADRERA